MRADDVIGARRAAEGENQSLHSGEKLYDGQC
jgi:hypothetical protein